MSASKTFATVLEWLPDQDFHRVKTDSGEVMRVDLMVSGALPESTMPSELVGRRISWERTHAFVSIAHGVSIHEEAHP